MYDHTCCFLGHRTIEDTEDLRKRLAEAIENLIINKAVDTFLFGSKSQFDVLCLELVSALKEKYPHVKRIYVRAEFPIISEAYNTYLLKHYDGTYYPEKLCKAGRAVYVERNLEMIDKSRFCVVYCNATNLYDPSKSGTKIALNYALKKHREIMLFP